MSDFEQRLRSVLEPILSEKDPRTRISAYHDMPYAIFVYDPEDELALRKELALLATRLEQKGKRVKSLSMARFLDEVIAAQGPLERLVEAEKTIGLEAAIDTVHGFLTTYMPLVDMVANAMPSDPDPLRDIVFIVRVGALFPVYRTFSLLEQLKGRVDVPTVLFFPGVRDGAAGLKFMGVLDPEHNYRPKIF